MYLKDYSTKVRANLNDVMRDIQQLQNQGCNETHPSVVDARFNIQMYLGEFVHVGTLDATQLGKSNANMSVNCAQINFDDGTSQTTAPADVINYAGSSSTVATETANLKTGSIDSTAVPSARARRPHVATHTPPSSSHAHASSFHIHTHLAAH